MTAPKFPRFVTASMRRFLAGEAAGGIVLMVAAALALVVANLPATASSYAATLAMPVGPMIPHHGAMTPLAWINDGLMALFFLLVGLEIKREVVGGELARAETRRLPVIAAACGMAVPAAVYLGVAGHVPGLARGWAIPAATDIAFAVGVLALLGNRVPASLKLLLTSIAIVDDMGAVAIIVLAYSAHLNLAALAGAAAVIVALAIVRPRALWPYLMGFLVAWALMLLSGVHATLAGLAIAMTVPAGPLLERLEHGLHPWVAFGIVPLFGFANAGVNLGGMQVSTLADPLVVAVLLGLFVGKQLGIFGSIWLAVKLRMAERPDGVCWRQVYGVALVAGIGFTMSLFIGGLAFPDQPALVDRVKLGVLSGSLLSALAGYAVLRMGTRD
ncbi:Na+/H+ antiporter NhaA [uncultured Sphingomonas sp.]|uniref:Na+/H+ antiporter NhaA n=1 Tax=uncultured Sphingomonas sp. TaxID=158754 RepID=UPI0025D21542|nr:Na+/H+ antiporter NhaA [uncultured Sphingomonas sp.]